MRWVQVAPLLAGAKSKGANAKAGGAKLKMVIKKAAAGRKLQATCDTVPILITACALSPPSPRLCAPVGPCVPACPSFYCSQVTSLIVQRCLPGINAASFLAVGLACRSACWRILHTADCASSNLQAHC